MSSWASPAITLGAALLLLGCPGDTAGPVEPPPAAELIVLLQGDAQTGVVGIEISVRPSVRITNAAGTPVPGATVRWAVISGGGSLVGDVVVADQDGVATVGSWMLGPDVGSQSMRAAISGLFPVIFRAEAAPGPAAGIEKAEGDADLGTVGLPALVPPRVRIVDSFGNPVPGVAVRFAVRSGGGAGTGFDQTTDAEGLAEVGGWTLGPNPSLNELEATLPGSPSIPASIFTVQTFLNTPAALVIIAGGSQGVAVGEAVMVPPTVLVLDAADNTVAAIAVDFAVEAGGGTVTDANTLSDAEGEASPGSWTMGPGVDQNRLTASLPAFPGVTAATFFGFPSFPGGFSIEVEHLDPLTAEEATAFANAVAFWEQVLINEFDDLDFSVSPMPENACSSREPLGFPHPGRNTGTVDEILIFTQRRDIIEAGVVARGGPCANRVINGFLTPFTAVGLLTLDPVESAVADQAGLLEDVYIHHLGHVLGFGTGWWALANPVNPSRPTSPGVDTHFDGETARAAFAVAGGTAVTGATQVPVDNSAIPRFADVHWRESSLGNELMTGVLTAGGNPFSAISIGAMHDLLYTVDPSAAEPYQIPQSLGTSGVSRSGGIRLGQDTWSGPLFYFGEGGFATPIESELEPALLTREAVFRSRRR